MQSLLSATDEHSCIFVVGKGGVGKTTTAGAIALAAADAGEITHLVTTDPAESLGDLFQATLPSGRPVPSPCTDRLTLEAFDARHWGAAWFEPRRDALAEIMEQGTYLDEADVDGLLAQVVPGVDEAMGALRIGRLAAARERGVVRRIVVDTAPTGHTLRLLDARASLGAWVTALRTMAAKADAVASALLHMPVRLEGERALDEIEEELHELAGVLASAAFVIVHRRGTVVRAETGRLAARLRQRGLRIVAYVGVGGSELDLDGAIQMHVPLLPDATGCDGLRRFAGAVAEAPLAARSDAVPGLIPATTPDAPSDATAGTMGATGITRAAAGAPARAASWIRAAPWRLIWFAGKGGVGKSTCAAAAAAAVADQRSVSLYSTDPAGSLGDVIGVTPGAEPLEAAPRLRVQQVQAESAFANWLADYRGEVERVFASVGLEQAAQLDRRVIDSLLEFAPPGIDEVVSLTHILDSVERDETLVLDTAPTGHFLRLLEMPDLALDWTHALMRILLRAGVAGSLDALSERMLGFAKRLKTLRSVLSDPERTAVFVVTLEERMVRAETERLRAALHAAGIREAGVIVNRARSAHAYPAARTVHAPEQATPPVGIPALRSFFESWELA